MRQRSPDDPERTNTARASIHAPEFTLALAERSVKAAAAYGRCVNISEPDGRFAGFAPVGPADSVAANRTWWDREAADYRDEHAADLAHRLIWGPEGLDEHAARLLGDVRGRVVLEVGAGAADGTAWLTRQGARAVASDLSAGMLRQSPAPAPPRVQADARVLPLADASVDVVFTAYGALPFVGDPERVHAEVARVLVPGGRWVFALGHPVRWAFPDDGGEDGLQVTRSYFDRTPYLETDDDGRPTYTEHHRTLGDQVRMLTAAGFRLLDLVEPTWPDGLLRTWGGWSPLRGRLIPGTAIFVSELLPTSRAG
jgi:SAM-dependent methyltransferase